jgi:hypothetical protein
MKRAFPSKAWLLFSFFAASITGVVVACSPSSRDLDRADSGAAAAVEVDDEDQIPCEPRHVLENVCQRCHRNPPIRGAPFPLVTRSNIVRSTPDGQIRELMIEQLQVRRMPLSPETIEPEQRETLLAWLRAGAPAVAPTACETVDAATDALDVEADDATAQADAGETGDP